MCSANGKDCTREGERPSQSADVVPLENRYSPAEMLFDRKIRTTVPVFYDQLKPSWPGLEKVREHGQESKLIQTNQYNSSHRCTKLSMLSEGDCVWDVDQKTPAVVTEKTPTPRSYKVETEAGSPI